MPCRKAPRSVSNVKPTTASKKSGGMTARDHSVADKRKSQVFTSLTSLPRSDSLSSARCILTFVANLIRPRPVNLTTSQCQSACNFHLVFDTSSQARCWVADQVRLLLLMKSSLFLKWVVVTSEADPKDLRCLYESCSHCDLSVLWRPLIDKELEDGMNFIYACMGVIRVQSPVLHLLYQPYKKQGQLARCQLNNLSV